MVCEYFTDCPYESHRQPCRIPGCDRYQPEVNDRSLNDRIPSDYQRPKCPRCHKVLSFIHETPGGSRYACMPCEFGPGYPSGEDSPVTPSEASWIIRHGITTSESRGAACPST